MDLGRKDGAGSGSEGSTEEEDNGVVGGFARAFDLISSEYGWPDDAILDLPVARFRQIVAAIQIRVKRDIQIHAAIVEWQTKILGSVTAATIEMAEGVDNPVLKFVMDLDLVGSLLGKKARSQPEPLLPNEEADPDTIAKYGFDPEHPSTPDVAVGSYERAATTLSTPGNG